MNISPTYIVSPRVYSSKNNNQQSFTGFSEKLTNNKVFNAIENKVAEGCVKLVSTDSVKNLVTKTTILEKFDKKLTSHLIVLGSTLLSGFYILKTLNNKKMDEDKRKTLAINQGFVYIVSTVMAYSFDGWARKNFNKIFEKFEKVNANADKVQMKKWKAGFGLARTIIIVDTVYRFIAPVIVTPFANYVGNRLKENKNRNK